MENLGHDFDLFKDHLSQINEDVAAKLNEYYPDQAKIAAYLEAIAAQKDLKVFVYDVDGNKIAGADHRKGYGLNLELKNFTVVGRKVIYVVELVYPFSIANLGELGSVQKIRDVAVVLLPLLIGLLILYLHFSLVRPLTMLNRGLETTNYRRAGTAIPAATYKRRDELGDLARKYSEMQSRLAAAHRQQTEMIASISHDLKTPLTSILGFLERLNGRKVAAEQAAEYHQILYQKARDIQDLIAEFNDYMANDLEAGTAINLTPIRLRGFFEEICAEYQSELAGKGIRFQCAVEIPPRRDPWLEIDPQKIRRVFSNLVGNSLKYAVNLSVIHFKCAVREGWAVFAVEDDGPGVPADELGAIFEKFYRLEKSRSRDKGGSGLGLAICREIITAHGGTIEGYQPPHPGLGISFSLPLQAVHKAS